jgi:hypothetical protein
MPELTSVQAYVSLEQRSPEQAFGMFKALLGDVRLLTPEVAEWLGSLRWSPADDGLVYPSRQRWLAASVGGKELQVAPHALGWTRQVLPALRSDWLEVGLLLKTEDLAHPSPDWRYRAEVTRSLYELLAAFLPISVDAPVFMTNESQDGRPWEAWIANGDGAWEFDLAIASEQVRWPRQPIPVGFSRATLKGGIAIARDEVWPVLPWRS